MKALHIAFTLTVALALPSRQASAQTQPQSRGDFTGSLGVQSVGVREENFFSGRRFDGGLYGAVAAGWYWTEHLKTEIDFGARTKSRVWIASPALVAGAQTYYPTDKTFSRRTLALGQQYQFFHNAWFHPYLGAGMDLTIERSTLHRAAITVYDPAARTSRQIAAEQTEPARTDFRVDPFVESGFKAYMTPRTFFRSDLQVAFRSGVDGVVTRFGFGFDF